LADGRAVLEQYVTSGALMQLATVTPDGSPHLCNVWYDAHFNPDVLRFISRWDRNHSEHIRSGRPVAGSIIAIPLEGLGQLARGITFTGDAVELPQRGISAQLHAFLSRWPNAREGIDEDRLRTGHTPVRLYEVAVSEWVLFDEQYFPAEPRQRIAGRR
jgi:hypothetical protein